MMFWRRILRSERPLPDPKPAIDLENVIMQLRVRFSLAMFNLVIDSKLRACDLTRLGVRDIRLGQRVASRATVMQQETQRPVQFEITEAGR
jgi:hypothetical protein